MTLFSQVSDDLTQDTLWEITTSWQDALSSNDLQLNDALLAECACIVNEKLSVVEEMSVEKIEHISEIVSKLILCSIERIDDEPAKYQRADQIVDAIFDQRSKTYRSKQSYVEHVCHLLESLTGRLTVPDVGSRLGTADGMRSVETIDSFMKLASFRFNVIFKITCSVKKHRPAEEDAAAADEGGEASADDEYTEDFCDIDENLVKNFSDSIFEEIVGGIYIAGMSNTLLASCYQWSESTELCMLHLTEQIPLYLQNVSKSQLATIRDQLLAAAKTKGQLWSNCCLFLTSIEPYNDPENGVTLLREEDAFSDRHSVTYVNWLQTFTEKTGDRLLPIDRNIFVDDVAADLLVKSTTLRCLIRNYAQTDMNNQDDRKIMESSVALMNSLYLECKRDKPFFLYNE